MEALIAVRGREAGLGNRDTWDHLFPPSITEGTNALFLSM